VVVPECTRAKKRLVEKCRESNVSVMTYIRTKLRFARRSTLAACKAFKANEAMFTSRISQTMNSVEFPSPQSCKAEL